MEWNLMMLCTFCAYDMPTPWLKSDILCAASSLRHREMTPLIGAWPHCDTLARQLTSIRLLFSTSYSSLLTMHRESIYLANS